MQTKSIDLLVKEAPGEVPGIIAYASTFDRIPDAYGDIIRPGAFKGTLERLKASGNNLPLLYGHVMDDPANIIGTVTKAEEDAHGLLVEAAFDMDNPNAQQVRRAVLAKAITKLSFAFTVLDQDTVTLEDGTQANELRELELYEVSLVVVPANPRAQVVEAKAAEPESNAPLGVENTEPAPVEAVKAEEPEGVKAEEPEAAKGEESEENTTTQKGVQKMDIKELDAIATAQPAEKDARAIIRETFIGKGLKDSGRFSVATPEIKGFAGTPQWLPTVSRNVAGIGPDYTLADLFGQETISGNAYTFVRLGNDAWPQEVAEGAAKPNLNIAADPLTIPLTKVAGYTQESDELLEDADWLVSAIETRGIRMLRKSRDDYAMTTLDATVGIQSATVTDIDEAAILAAISAVKGATGYDADAIIINPEDYVALVIASLANPRTLLGPDYKTFLGVPIYQDQFPNPGECYVGAFKDGATLVQKGGVRVEMSNSDQDDFIHNLVKIRLEQRLALAVREPSAFVKVAESGGNGGN